MNPGGFNPSGGHTGEDIAIPVGTPLVAMADGVVVHAGYFQGSYASNPWWIQPSFAGFVVSIDYGPYISHYAHCSGSPVRAGQSVTQGQVVAYSGNTGSATTGPHLHWEVMPDGFNLNNGRYGRINPRSILTTITTQASTEDDMFTDEDRANLKKLLEASTWTDRAMQGLAEKTDELVINARKTFWNTEEAKVMLQSAKPADVAAQINAAGIAADVRDELVKLLAGNSGRP